MNKRTMLLSVTAILLGLVGNASAYVPAAPSPVLAGAGIIPSSEIIATDQVGSLNGSFRVNESGAATYSISIASSPGTAGVTPEISLNYSSQGGNGVLGVGWSIGGLSGITRCRQSLHQDNNPLPITFTGTDRFCMDGQRLLLTSGTYGAANSTYKTEIDSFAKITAKGGSLGHPDYWEIERKDGSKSTYGGNGDAESEQNVLNLDGTLSVKVMTWALNIFEDSVGNKIDYNYYNDTEGHRIKNIKYAFGISNTEGARLEFAYDDRPEDPSEGYIFGYLLKSTKRLTTIKSINEETLVRQYNLDYKEVGSGVSAVLRLKSVQECDTQCRPATTFTWAEPQSGFASTPSGSFNMITRSRRGLMNYLPADINGDGKMDLVWLEWDLNGDDYDHQLKYAISDGTKLVSATFANGAGERSYQEDAGSEKVIVRVLDYNADGRQDVIVYNQRGGQWNVLLSKPQLDGSWKLSTTGIATQITDDDVTFSDINSDGLVDVIWTTTGQFGYRLMEVDPTQTVSSNHYYRWGNEVFASAPVGVNVVDSGRYKGEIVSTNSDYNGDGRSDLTFLETQFIDDNQLNDRLFLAHILTSDQQGWIQYEQLGIRDRGDYENAIPGSAVSTNPGAGGLGNTVEVVDVNGDGLSDLFTRFSSWDSLEDLVMGPWRYQINTGEGLSSPVEFGLIGAQLRPQFVDYNHDGFIDVIWHDVGNAQLKVRLWDKATSSYSSEGVIRSTNGNDDHAHLFMDVTADGVVDYVKVEKDKLYTYPGISSETSNVITKVENGLGAVTDIAYESLGSSEHYERIKVSNTTQNINFCYPVGSVNCSNHSYSMVNEAEFYTALNGGWDLPSGNTTFGKSAPVLELNGAMPIVTSVESSAPILGISTTKSAISYYYGEAKIQASGRGNLGFHALKTVDEQTGVSTITSYRQDWPFIGFPLNTKTYSSAGKLLSESENTWGVKNITNWSNAASVARQSGTQALGSLQPYITKSVDETYDLVNSGAAQGDLLKTITTETTQDNYGNPTQIKVTTAGGGKKFQTVTNNVYAPPGLTSIFSKEKGRLSKATVATKRDEDNDGVYEESITRISTFTYYTSGLTLGLLKTETVEPGAKFQSTNTYMYDEFGNKIRSWVSAKDPDTNVTYTRCNGPSVQGVELTEYDPAGRYVDIERDCQGRKLSEVISRNVYGAPTQVHRFLDGNASQYIEANYSYTSAGRRYFEADSTGAFSAATITDCGGVAAGLAPRTIRGAGGQVIVQTPVG